MAERFYVNSELRPGPFTLEGPEAHHLATVCRLGPGDLVCLFNGDGRQYPAQVQSLRRRAVLLKVLSAQTPARELGFRLEVATPLPKGDRAPFLVEKLTELGVTALVPLRTAHAVVQPREAKLERLRRHVIEASKQCGRNRLLEVRPLTDWAAFCQDPSLPALKVLAHPGADQPAPLAGTGPADVAAAVGPEGGFTEEEVVLARQAGWVVVGLGPCILRVETAALVLAVRFAFTTQA